MTHASNVDGPWVTPSTRANGAVISRYVWMSEVVRNQRTLRERRRRGADVSIATTTSTAGAYVHLNFQGVNTFDNIRLHPTSTSTGTGEDPRRYFEVPQFYSGIWRASMIVYPSASTPSPSTSRLYTIGVTKNTTSLSTTLDAESTAAIMCTATTTTSGIHYFFGQKIMKLSSGDRIRFTADHTQLNKVVFNGNAVLLFLGST